MPAQATQLSDKYAVGSGGTTAVMEVNTPVPKEQLPSCSLQPPELSVVRGTRGLSLTTQQGFAELWQAKAKAKCRVEERPH